MANHKTKPIFVRIKTSQDEVILCNPEQLAGVRIKEKYEAKNRDGQTVATGDAIFLYYPAGTVTRYVVGLDISQEEFNYVSSALIEFLYLTKPEFQAKTAAMDAAKLAEWNKVIADEAEEEKAVTKA